MRLKVGCDGAVRSKTSSFDDVVADRVVGNRERTADLLVGEGEEQQTQSLGKIGKGKNGSTKLCHIDPAVEAPTSAHVMRRSRVSGLISNSGQGQWR